ETSGSHTVHPIDAVVSNVIANDEVPRHGYPSYDITFLETSVVIDLHIIPTGELQEFRGYAVITTTSRAGAEIIGNNYVFALRGNTQFVQQVEDERIAETGEPVIRDRHITDRRPGCAAGLIFYGRSDGRRITLKSVAVDD